MARRGALGMIDTIIYIFSKGLRGPIAYKLVLAGLAVMAVYGVYLWVFVQQAPVFLGSSEGGLVLTGVNENVPWGLYISFFTFWDSVAASAVIFCFAAYVFNDKHFKKVAPLAEAQAVAALLIALWGIVAHLGRPDRALTLMPQLPNLRSMFDWDFIVIFTYMALNAVAYVYTVHKYRRGEDLPKKFIIPFMVISTPFAIGLCSVSAWIFHALTARPALNTSLLAPMFIATAFASGSALLLILIYIIERVTGWFRVDFSVYRRTLNIIIISLATGLFFTLAEFHEVFWYTSEPLKREQLVSTILGSGFPPLRILFLLWISLGLAATIVGIIPAFRSSKESIAFTALVAFVAVFSEKTLATILPGFIVNPLGLPASYSITPLELFVSIGIHATVFILFAILIRSYILTVKGIEKGVAGT